MRVLANIGYVLLGIAIAVGIFCLTTAIGCAVNGISFTQQITQWFGEVVPVIEESTNSTANIIPVV